MFSSDFRQEVARVESKTAKELASKYNMSVCGTGGGTMYAVHTLSLSFDINRPVMMEEARAILVGSVEQYLKNINSNKALRPYLDEFPFPPRLLDMGFYVISHPKSTDQKFLRVFSLHETGPLKIPTIRYVFGHEKGEEVVKETYQEAKERLNESDKKSS